LFTGFLLDFWWQEHYAIGQLHQATSAFEGKQKYRGHTRNVAFDPEET